MSETFTATYSPDDNKLRLYASSRLDPETYARVRGSGFIWAPKQGLFVAPMWTPDRADLLEELAGEIGDEDTSLAERAEERAERFEDYSDSRATDAERAHAEVDRIADGIPLGQPILVGHHSERHARKDAERIENGMRRALKMWETSRYWQSRAKGAIQHAKYKELPGVRHRRIKGIEADKRKRERQKADAAACLKAFELVDRDSAWKLREDGSLPTRQERGNVIAGRLSGGPYMATVQTDGPNSTTLRYSAYDVLAPDDKRYQHCPSMTVDEVIAKFRAWVEQTNAYCDRWIAHYDLRLEYERAMLGEAGGIITDKTEYLIVPGGRVLVGREWVTVIRVNRKEGKILSLTTNARYCRVKGIEEVSEYEPPTAAAIQTVKAATKLPPLVNIKAEGAIEMTAAEYTKMYKDWKFTRTVPATAEHGAYRQRFTIRGGGYSGKPVFLTDAKIGTPPAPEDSPNPDPVEPPEQDLSATIKHTERLIESNAARAADPVREHIENLRESLKTGVQVVSAPQLFPTPMELARRVIELADLQDGECVLEPSAGTGNLIQAVHDAVDTEVLAYEINPSLCSVLSQKWPGFKTQVRQADFLAVNDFKGCYPRIVMNPPFVNGADIKHIQHALTFLKPGGRLVAICAAGPRQRAFFEGLDPDKADWIDLPPGSFAEAGTNVNAAILVVQS